MTYLHAIQYLQGVTSEKHAATPPSRKDAAQTEERLYAAYLSALGSGEQKFLYLSFASDRMGLLCAAYCRAALVHAGIRVGEIGDTASGELSEVLRIDGAPVSPAVLRELCHTARAAEQRLLRDAAKAAARQSAEDTVSPPPTALSAARRCGAVLPRLFADHGCRVILLIGDITDHRLRALSAQSPAHCIAVLSASEHSSVQRFPAGTGEVVCPTCSRATFRRVTDACSQAGSRLTLTATSHLSSDAPTLFSRRFSYRDVTDCTLRGGSSAMLRAVMLASEALFALGRLGCAIPADAMRRGFAAAALADYLSPRSVEPLLITHVICDTDDTDVLLSTLTEFETTLPADRRILCDTSLPSEEKARLAACGTLIDLPKEAALWEYLPAQQPSDDHIAPSVAYFLVGAPNAIADKIALWQRSLRTL